MGARNDPGPDAQRQAVRVHVPDEARRGVYANLALVSHSGHEFTVDLCQVQPGATPEEVPADVVVRAYLPPTLVPSLVRALTANLDAYERQFGRVHDVHDVQAPEPGG